MNTSLQDVDYVDTLTSPTLGDRRLPPDREGGPGVRALLHPRKGDVGAIETIIAEQGRRDPNMPAGLYELINRPG
jgi:hypothetical protein